MEIDEILSLYESGPSLLIYSYYHKPNAIELSNELLSFSGLMQHDWTRIIISSLLQVVAEKIAQKKTTVSDTSIINADSYQEAREQVKKMAKENQSFLSNLFKKWLEIFQKNTIFLISEMFPIEELCFQLADHYRISSSDVLTIFKMLSKRKSV